MPQLSEPIAAPKAAWARLPTGKALGNAGKGRMQIVESFPSNRLVVQVDWVRPCSARNINQFTLEPNDVATKLTWSMTGPNLFVMKMMSVFVNMDRNMGKHFEEGLQNLKAPAAQ